MRRSASRAARYAAQAGLSSRKHGFKWHYKFGDSWNSISLPTRNQRLARNLPMGLSKSGQEGMDLQPVGVVVGEAEHLRPGEQREHRAGCGARASHRNDPAATLPQA